MTRVAAHGWRVAALCTALAACVGMANVSRLRCISRDGIHFIQFAGQLRADAKFYVAAHKSQPGYSAMILAAYATMGGWLSADSHASWRLCGQLIAAIGYVCCVPLLYLLTRRLFGGGAACVAALLAVAWPQAAQLGGDVLSDMPHLALYLGAMLIGGRAIFGAASKAEDSTQAAESIATNAPATGEPRAVRPVQATAVTLAPWPRFVLLAVGGVLASLAYYIRQEALPLPAAMVLLIWWYWRGSNHQRGLRRFAPRIAATGVVIAAFVAPQIPYIAVTGSLMHKKSWRELFVRRAPETQAATPPYLMTPVKLVEAWARSGRYVLSTLALLACLWPRVARPRRDWRNLVLLLMLAQALAVERRVANFGEFSTRYALIPAALTLPWAAAILWTLISGGATRGRDSRLAGIALLSVIVIVLGWFAIEPINQTDGLMADGGAWLRTQAAVDAPILADTRAARVVYYADRPWFEVRQWRPSAADLLAVDDQTGRAAAWCVVVADSDSRAEDDQLTQAICREPRWPGAVVAREWHDGARMVRVIQLRRRT